ncbi:response regulator [Diaphorobacter limosus]|jgi:two-component system response regulator TctD|uniref:Response regulator n=1 Tax=Diaphorobacter limosus TaxID=3036128 RepID=A0ABZ0J462_9BURK|nr:response regulator [Diaphorobacter sp. Y-1]WOO31729.1 response regulator [Diaphorobacter sp. Y-1]
MRTLLIEDNPKLVRTLAAELRTAGMVLDTVADGLHADALLQVERYDVVILDLGLPSLDGIEVLRRIRARGDDVPVLILTASGEVPDRVRGLNAGADDYLPKPFDLHELVARLRALARRHRGRAHAVFKVGALSYDSVAMQFHIAGKPLELPRREHGVLEILVTRSGQPVSKRDISGQLCSLDDAVSPEALELYVHRLRRRLEGSGASIRTLRGLGYRLEAVDDAPA